MTEAWQAVVDTAQQTYGDSKYFLFFLLCILYLWIFEKDRRKTVVVPAVLMAVVIINPVFYKYVGARMSGGTYWRMFWCIPIVPVLALTIVSLISKCKTRLTRTLMCLICITAIVAGGNYIYQGEKTSFSSVHNFYKIPDEIPAIAEMLLAQDSNPQVVAEGDARYFLRQYSAYIDLMYGRNAEGYIDGMYGYATVVHEELVKEKPDLAIVSQVMEEHGFDFLVVDLSTQVYSSDYYYEVAGFEAIGAVGNYHVYRRSDRMSEDTGDDTNADLIESASSNAEAADNESAQSDTAENNWTVTQYGSDSLENQMMFYTITDEDGHLVIIDGGHGTDDEVDAVRSVIKEHNNHVDAWIITHAHPDHVGAFNVIMGGNGERSVQVDQIYTVQINKARYEETAKWYDEPEYFESFYILTQSMDNVMYLQAGDEIDLIGLDMKVLSVWNESVDAMENNEINNGSMMFKVSGANKSMLFCADVQKEMEESIIETYANELNVDYVQLGHHGNWGLTTDFYDLTSPEAVFFDAPSGIIDTEDSNYDAYELKHYFEEQGVTIYRFSNAPNSVILS